MKTTELSLALTRPTMLHLSVKVEDGDIVSLLTQYLTDHREDHSPAFLVVFGWLNHGLAAALTRARKNGHQITRDEFLRDLVELLVHLAQVTMKQRAG